MGKTYTKHSASLKAQVALAAIKGQQTVNEIASASGVHPNQVAQWKKQALEGLETVFTSRAAQQAADAEALQDRLYQEIGQLKVELDWLKKKSGRQR